MAEATKPGRGTAGPAGAVHAAGPAGLFHAARASGPTRAAASPGFILVVTGPSGAGKGTLVARLLEQRPDCVFSVSATTRPRRGNEDHGRDYIFLSHEEFMARVEQGYFLEWANVHGNLYGTPVGPVNEQVRAGQVVVLDVDVQGGASVRRSTRLSGVRPRAVTVFVYPPSLESLRARLESRGTDSAEVIEGRLRNAPGELAQAVHYDYIIMNDDLERAAAALLAIHDSELARVRGSALST